MSRRRLAAPKKTRIAPRRRKRRTPARSQQKAEVLAQTQLELALQARDMGSFEWTLKGDILHWDDRAYELFGATRLQHPDPWVIFDQRVALDDQSQFEHQVKELIHHGRSLDATLRVQWPGKPAHTLKVIGLLQRDAKNNPLAIRGFIWDITSLLERDRHQRDQVRLVDQIAHSLSAALLLVHIGENRALFANHATQAVLGIDPLQVLLCDIKSLRKRILSTDRKRFLEALLSVMRGDERNSECVVRARSEEKGLQWIRVRFSAFKSDLNGRANELLILLEDVSQAKAFEERAESQRLAIIHASRLASLGEMSAGIAHEINNPLTILTGHLRLLQKRVKAHADTDSEALLIKMAGTMERISHIIRGLRHFARDAQLDPLEQITARSVIEGALLFCSERFKQHGIDLTVSLPAQEVNLECRPTQLTQVLLSLIQNSFDAIHTQSDAWVKIQLEETPSEWIISVTDSGPGIPKPIRNKLMTPFFTTKEVGQGTGLGLSISNGMLQSHGGRLVLDETSAHTRFEMRLPRNSKRLKNQAA